MNFLRSVAHWQRLSPSKRRAVLIGLAVVAVVLIVLRVLSARAVTGDSGGRSGRAKGAAAPAPAVDVVLARAGMLRDELEYTGTTRAAQEITIRSRTEGRLLNLNLDVGDRVRQGQKIGRIDDRLLKTALHQAEAELASRRSEVAAAQTEVGNARTQVEQARLDLYQKQADYQRTRRLWEQGYEARQTAERALTSARLARQVLRSTEEQVRNATASLRSTEAQVAAQRAVVAQERERLSFSTLNSPIDGAITARFVQAGDLLQPGADVVRIGDLRQVQVDVSVSELEMGQVQVGSPVRVRLDAVGDLEMAATVDRISPQADPVSRLVPITISLPNGDGRIGAGMLARVRFGRNAPLQVLIPEGALQVGPRRAAGGAAEPAGTDTGSAAGADDAGTVFVISGEPASMPDAAAAQTGERREVPITERRYRVEARQVQIGDRGDGQVEVRSGLQAGERVVSRSSAPLKDGQEVRPSILSQEALEASGAPQDAARQSPADAGSANPADRAPRGTGPASSGDPGRSSASSPARAGGGSSRGPSQGGFSSPSIGGSSSPPATSTDAPVTGGTTSSSPATGTGSGGRFSGGSVYGNTGQRGSGANLGVNQGINGNRLLTPNTGTAGRLGQGNLGQAGSAYGRTGTGRSTGSGTRSFTPGTGSTGGFRSSPGIGGSTGTGTGTGVGTFGSGVGSGR